MAGMKNGSGQFEAERRWPFRVLLVTVCAMLAVSLFLNCSAAALLAGKGGEDVPEDEYPDLQEVASWGEDGPKVVRIELKGAIVRENEESLFGSGPDPVERVLQQIRAANNDEEVEGILFEVDSPGGGVTASDEIYHELLKFKEGAGGRVVVGLVRDMAASGGYYAMLPCDEIVAQPTAIVGSIGVLMAGVNFSGLAAKAGVEDMTVKSGANKDLMNPLKPVDEGQKAIVQAAVDADYERFLGLVAKHRRISEKKLRPLCDGRIFSAAEALSKGFVDMVGYREDALALLAKKLGSEGVRAVKYEKQSGLLDELLGMKSPLAPVVSRLGGSTAKREYRWAP
jgi:protease-4